MLKLIMLKGLPASGKSTWAKDYITKFPDLKFKRINKDDFRSMLDNSVWSKENEKFVLSMRDMTVVKALTSGFSVIIDDTNFSPTHEKRLRDLVNQTAKKIKEEIEFQVVLFNTTLEECIQRDLRRPVSVGEKVIRDMYDKYLAPIAEAYPYDENLTSIVISDLDGTISKVTGRSPYDWQNVERDLPNMPVINNLRALKAIGMPIFIFSGRDGRAQKDTVKWLQKWEVPYDKIVMRAPEDTRKDSIVKEEMFMRYIKGKYNVMTVFDDRDQVVELWRKKLGLSCFQVDYGNF